MINVCIMLTQIRPEFFFLHASMHFQNEGFEGRNIVGASRERISPFEYAYANNFQNATNCVA